MPRQPSPHETLFNPKHEQFARCLGMENELHVCALGVGYDIEQARALCRQKKIRARAEQWFNDRAPENHPERKFKYPV